MSAADESVDRIAVPTQSTGLPFSTQADRQARWPSFVAAAAIVACGVLTAAVLWAGAEPDAATLAARASAAAAAGDDAAAVLHYRHLLAIRPAEAAYAIELASAIDRLGRRAEAMAVLAAVAPPTGGGHAPAHLRQAEWRVEAFVLHGVRDPANLAAARTHAEAASYDPATRSAARSLLDVIDGAAPQGMPQQHSD